MTLFIDSLRRVRSFGWPIALSLFMLLRVASGAQAAAGGLHVEVTLVDPQVFHVLAYYGTPPRSSPFVVLNRPWQGTKYGRYQLFKILKAPTARLIVSRAGTIDLKDKLNHSLLARGNFTLADGSISLSVEHDEGLRFYGSGNAGINESGPLVHDSGTSIVSNGATRIPFIFSTGQFGILAANDEADISWQDQDGTLTWKAPGTYLDLYVLVGRNPYNILDAYSRLTGRAPIPPRWTFGFLQSRLGYA